MVAVGQVDRAGEAGQADRVEAAKAAVEDVRAAADLLAVEAAAVHGSPLADPKSRKNIWRPRK